MWSNVFIDQNRVCFFVFFSRYYKNVVRINFRLRFNNVKFHRMLFNFRFVSFIKYVIRPTLRKKVLYHLL